MKNWKTTVCSWMAGLGGYVYLVDPTILQVVPEPYRTVIWKLLGFMAFAGVIGTGTFAKDKALGNGSDGKSGKNGNDVVNAAVLPEDGSGK